MVLVFQFLSLITPAGFGGVLRGPEDVALSDLMEDAQIQQRIWIFFKMFFAQMRSYFKRC